MPAQPAARLNRERVLRAALGIADADGLDALTMRRLASELDVEAMSLYNHVTNKGDLIAGMLGIVASEIVFPTGELGWREAVRARSVAAYQAFVRRPWAAKVWMSAGTSPARLSQSNAVLRCLKDAGLPPTAVYTAYHVLDGYALGYALQRLDLPTDIADLEAMVDGFLAQLPESDYPDFGEHARQHLDTRFTSQDSFEFGLDLFLDGLERLAQ